MSGGEWGEDFRKVGNIEDIVHASIMRPVPVIAFADIERLAALGRVGAEMKNRRDVGILLGKKGGQLFPKLSLIRGPRCPWRNQKRRETDDRFRWKKKLGR